MAKWVQLPSEPLRYNKHQIDFLNARRQRVCDICQLDFQANSESWLCPQCGGKGERVFDRLTIIAGRRFGKSRFGAIAGVEEACIPNTTGWACAPTIPKLHRYVIPAFAQLIPPSWVAHWNNELKDLYLKNGSLIHFQTLEEPDQGRGQGLDWLWIDEVCELTRKHWEVIRPSLAGPAVAFFTTTPRGYDWVYDELYKPAEDLLPGFWGCRAPSSSSSNPKLSSEFLARERQQMSETMYRQEYEADFVTFQGAVYGDLLTNQILRKGDPRIQELFPDYPKIDSTLQALIGIDTGADHPFGGCKLVSTPKGLVVIGEYLERHRSFAEHALALRRLGGEHLVRWAINKNERQARIELAQPQHSIVAVPAENDQVAGIERVKTWLYNQQLWFIEELCPKTVRQMSAYRYADNYNAKDDSKHAVEQVYKKEDELPDCIRYAVMTWPALPKVKEDGPRQPDISQLSPQLQDTITKFRRINAEPKVNDQDVVQDFYL